MPLPRFGVGVVLLLLVSTTVLMRTDANANANATPTPTRQRKFRAPKPVGVDGSMPPGPNTWRAGMPTVLRVKFNQTVVFRWGFPSPTSSTSTTTTSNATTTRSRSVVQLMRQSDWDTCSSDAPPSFAVTVVPPQPIMQFTLFGAMRPGTVLYLADVASADEAGSTGCTSDGVKVMLVFLPPPPTLSPTSSPTTPTTAAPTRSPQVPSCASAFNFVSCRFASQAVTSSNPRLRCVWSSTEQVCKTVAARSG